MRGDLAQWRPRSAGHGRQWILALVLLLLIACPAVAREVDVVGAASKLRRGLTEGSARLWESASEDLVEAGAAALTQLELLTASADHRARFLAVRIAGDLFFTLDGDDEVADRERATRILLEGLADEHPIVRDISRELVALARPRAAVPILIGRLEHAVGDERQQITELLVTLARMPLGDSHEAWSAWWADAGEGFEMPPPPPEEGAGAMAREGPSYHGETVSSRRVVFIVDRSLSMAWGDRIGRAKRELVDTLKELPEDARFDIVFFGGRVKAWRPELQEATPSSIKRAVHWVMEMEIIRATATYEALMVAMAIPEVDTIYLLSDGDPNVGRFTDPEDICDRVRAQNTFKRIRIFTIGFFFGEVPPEYRSQSRATDKTRAFMRRLAAENRGRFAEIDE